jgi:arginine:pyruvate transaminase
MARLGGQQVLRAVPPEGAMYVMVDVRGTGMTGTHFAEALLEEAQVAVMPGESFGAAAAGHVRVALTLPDAAFETASTGCSPSRPRRRLSRVTRPPGSPGGRRW